MRSKLKILALMGVIGVGVVFVGCNEKRVVELPPVESEVGKVESAKARAEREESELHERNRAKLQEEIQNLDSYTKEELESNTEMEPFLRDALLMAKAQKEERVKKRDAEKRDLEEKERMAGELLKVIDGEKRALEVLDAKYAEIADAQYAREESERAERNAEGVAPKGMVWVPGGKFLRGSRDLNAGQRQKYGEEYPAHMTEVDGFYMDETEVTNAQFAEFVKVTGYVTLAERGLSSEEFPEARLEDLQGGANVFRKTEGSIDPWVGSAWRWWNFTPGANWRSPEGPGSDIRSKMDHPVTCVNYNDAVAYATWAGKRLPTEAEWERAARAGRHGEKYIWGEEVLVDGRWMANVYQGEFPSTHEEGDGYLLTAPARSYPANGWGLYDMAGNVWEICNDYYHPGYYHAYIKNPVKNPKGPLSPITDGERMKYDGVTGTCPEPRGETHRLTHLRVARGGSFLCSSEYCLRFRPGARHHHEVLTPSQHQGFRCVKDVE